MALATVSIERHRNAVAITPDFIIAEKCIASSLYGIPHSNAALNAAAVHFWDEVKLSAVLFCGGTAPVQSCKLKTPYIPVLRLLAWVLKPSAVVPINFVLPELSLA